MQPNDWVAVAGGTVTIIAALIAGNVWLIRSVVRQELQKFEDRVRHDFQPKNT